MEKHRDNEKIMHISGYKPHGMNVDLPYSYFYSRQAIVWGWATWAKSWKNMDVDMKEFPAFKKDKVIENYSSDVGIQKYMLDKWEETYLKKNSSWAYAWSFCIEHLNGKTIVPNRNMILNIGYGEDATNTKVDTLNRGNNKSTEMIFPLIHPEFDNSLSEKGMGEIEKEIFYKIQKSKRGLLIRRLVPMPILELVKRILGVQN